MTILEQQVGKVLPGVLSCDKLDNDNAVVDSYVANTPMDWSISDLICNQSKDDVAAFLTMKKMFPNERPLATSILSASKEVKLFWTKWEEYKVVEGILYQLKPDDNDRLCYVIPLHRRQQVLQYLHQIPDAGHFGVHHTTAAAIRRFYWPRMRNDIQRFVKSCLRCEMAKAGPGKGKFYVQETKEWLLISSVHFRSLNRVTSTSLPLMTISASALLLYHFDAIQVKLW